MSISQLNDKWIVEPSWQESLVTSLHIILINESKSYLWQLFSAKCDFYASQEWCLIKALLINQDISLSWVVVSILFERLFFTTHFCSLLCAPLIIQSCYVNFEFLMGIPWWYTFSWNVFIFLPHCDDVRWRPSSWGFYYLFRVVTKLKS